MFVFRYNNYSKDTRFSVGLQNIAENDVSNVKTIIDETIRKVVE